MRQRTVSDNFWRDSQIWGLSQEDSATLLYLLTSPSSNIIGCYRLVWRIAAAEMGWTADQMLVVIKRLQEKGLIEYTDSGWVWVKIWWLHNSSAVALNPKSGLIKRARSQFADIPRDWGIDYGKNLEALGINLHEIGYPYTMDAPSHAPLSQGGEGGGGGPSHAPCDAPSINAQTHQLRGFDAPSTLPSTLPSTPPYTHPGEGRRGNRYLVSSNTTTTNSSSKEIKPVVVVNDLIFPPQTNQAERDSIQAALVSSGVGEEFWQQLVDELVGARMHRPISNPVGYIRGMAERAMSGTFIPEWGIGVARKREEAAALARQDEAQKKAFLKNQLPADAVMSRLPARTSAFLEKMTGGKAK